MNSRTLKESPKIILSEDFLSADECADLIALATPGLQPAEVVDVATGKGVENDYRTGLVCCFKRSVSTSVKAVEERIAAACGVRFAQLEYVQVNKYKVGDQFKAHHDWFDPTIAGHVSQLKMGGQRIMSVLIYLNEPEEGGETVFDAVHVRIPPKKGAMALWLNVLDGDGKVDTRVLHASLPILRGEKWVATCWIRERAFDGSEEEAHSIKRAEAAKSATSLRQQLADIERHNIEDGHREIMEVCERRQLVLAPKPVILPDGRIGATLDLIPGRAQEPS